MAGDRPWKREEIIGPCRLLLGDCLEVLPTLGRVDAVVTDPPYEIEAHGAGRRLNGRAAELANRRVREVDRTALDFAPISEVDRARVSRLVGGMCDGWVLVFCQAEAVALWRDSLEAGGAAYRRSMVWIKPDAAPQLSGDRPAQGYESIVAAWAGSPPSRWNGGGRRGVFVFSKGRDLGGHPTRKPVALIAELIGLFSNAGEHVVDPFMGSGTAGVAAARLGRRFTGVEADERYFDFACERVRNAVAQPDLFVSAPAAPIQGAML